jgi:predicted transcriptional regulator of viral defense system
MSETMNVLYEIAEPHAGYFTAAQAVGAGVSRRALSGRTKAGDIDQVRHGLYRLRRFPSHPFEDVIATCLWVGPDSAASHETALAVHGVSDAMPTSIHVTVPRLFRGKQNGVIIHRASLPEDERQVRDSVPVTTLARTLQDVAETSDPYLVEQAVKHAVSRGALSQRQLRRIVRETPALGPLIVDALADGE